MMRQLKLRHVADVRNSNVDKVIVDGERPVRLCNYVDVYKNDFIDSNMEFSAGSATTTEIASFALRVDDVIITKDSEDRNDIGVPALVRTTAPDLVCGYHLSMLRAKPGVAIGPFLFWALLSKPARDAFSNAAYGITRYGMALGGMKDVMIPLPDLATQKVIADFLDRETARIDQLIEKKQRLVEVLGEKSSATVEAAMKATPQKEWAKVKYHIAPIEQGWSPQAEERQVEPDEWGVLKLGAITTGRYVEAAHKALPADLAPRPALMVKVRDVLVARASGSPALVGRACYVDKVSRKLMISDKHFRLNPLCHKTDPAYLALVLNTRVARVQIEARLSSAEGMARNIGQDVIRSMKLPFPQLQRQREIVAKLDTDEEASKKITTAVTNSIDRLREYRAALITAAVTGQIDVTTYGNQGATDRTLDRIEEEMGG